MLAPNLVRRIERLKRQDAEYWDDEFYSVEALTDLEYREALTTAMNETNPKRGDAKWSALALESERKKRNSLLGGDGYSSPVKSGSRGKRER